MRIVFAGTTANAATTLAAMLNNEFGLGNYEVVGVLTRTDAPVGRKRVLTASPVAQVASEFGLTVIKANRVDSRTLADIQALRADLGLVVAYGALLKTDALEALPLGWINIHYSLLPKWRGASPVQSALLAGETQTGVSIFQLDEGMDTGPVWGSLQTDIQPDETSGDLLGRLTGLSLPLLSEVLPKISSRALAPTPQYPAASELARKFNRSDARISFFSAAIEIENRVRAFNPEPGAWCTVTSGETSEPIKILRARAIGAVDWASLDDGSTHSPGTVSLLKNKVLVACGAGSLLELREVQPSGKKAMPATDWYRGLSGKVVLT